MRCRADARPKCFLDGLWYSKHWKRERPHPGGRESCVCDAIAWRCEVNADTYTGPYRVRFASGESVLPAEKESEVAVWATETRDEPEGGLSLIGVINPAEGLDAEALARRRAEVVREIFLRNGVPAERVTIGAPITGNGSLVILRPVLDPPE